MNQSCTTMLATVAQGADLNGRALKRRLIEAIPPPPHCSMKVSYSRRLSLRSSNISAVPSVISTASVKP